MVAADRWSLDEAAAERRPWLPLQEVKCALVPPDTVAPRGGRRVDSTPVRYEVLVSRRPSPPLPGPSLPLPPVRRVSQQEGVVSPETQQM